MQVGEGPLQWDITGHVDWDNHKALLVCFLQEYYIIPDLEILRINTLMTIYRPANALNNLLITQQHGEDI